MAQRLLLVTVAHVIRQPFHVEGADECGPLHFFVVVAAADAYAHANANRVIALRINCIFLDWTNRPVLGPLLLFRLSGFRLGWDAREHLGDTRELLSHLSTKNTC